ncbi:MAG: HEPN domain-containing protein [Deltaproteobacteria bacterium]|nr:HEPN domain-containing protein [Deltaproteobacteria bacterium]
MKKQPKFFEINKLFKKASEDEIILTKHLNDKEVSDSIWGFHAQQAVEKILKAVLTFYEVEFPKTHDLTALAEYFQSSNIVLPFLIDELETLTPYAVTMRYDDEIETEIDRQGVYRFIISIRSWAEKIIQN